MRQFNCLYIVLLILCFFSSAAQAFSVDSIRFGVHSDKTRLVLDLSDIKDFRVFTLSDPYRMVIDLPSFEWQAGFIHKPEPSGVREVRYGNLRPGISRIVLDLARPVRINSAFILGRQGNKPHRLVIDFLPTTDDDFVQNEDKIFGTLTDNMPIATSVPLINPPPAPSRTAGSFPVPVPPKFDRDTVVKKPLIVIDPGHGGVDPGAIGANNVFEKDVTLALSKELRDLLKSSDQYRVMLTRQDDVFIKLRDRVAFARRHQADLFISIHADSINKSNVRGASFYTLSEKASDAQTAALAARENRADLVAGVDLSVEDDDVASILLDLTMRDTTNHGKFFANKMVDSFRVTGIKTLENPHRHAGFAVLKAPDIPSVLVEAGFMSNHKEASLLSTTSYRSKIAQALKKGIDAYFEQVRKNQRT